MDRIKRRRKKLQKPKNVLLSIVDPWDNKVASVYPVGLANRRRVALSDIPLSESATADETWPSSNSVVKIPSPWYKPNATSTQTSSTPHVESDNEDFFNHAWPQPWRDSTRTRCNFTVPPVTCPDGPIKPPRTGNDGNEWKPDSAERYHGTNKTRGENNVTPNYPSTLANSLTNYSTSDNNNCARVILEKIDNPCDRIIIDRVFDDRDNTKDCGNNFFREKIDKSEEFNDVNRNFLAEKDRARAKEENLVRDEENFSKNHGKTGIDEDSVILTSSRTESGLNSLFPVGRCTNDKDRLESVVYQLVHSRYGNRAVVPEQLNNSSAVNSPPRETFRTDATETLSKNYLGPEQFVDFGGDESIDSTTGSAENFIESMPAKVGVMDDIRINRQKDATSQFLRVESDSSTTFSNSGSTPNGSTLGSETEEDANDEEMAKVPLQAPPRRKARIVPSSGSQKHGIELSNGPDVQSPNSTITSVNSISSLLKEKLQLSIPQALRSSKKRQNADYKLRAFVGILFLCVVFLVGFAHVYYTQHVLQRAYFEKFRFNKNERVMHVYSSLGTEIIAARLGVGIPHETGVFPCLSHNQRRDAVCLEWLGQTRLYLAHSSRDDMHCYHVTWQSLNEHLNPKDCFDWSSSRGHWYGAGQIRNMAYPLEQGKLDLSPFVTGDIRKHPFGNVLKRYFLNSKGATILIDSETPLYVSINANRTKEFCMQAKHDAFAYINHLTPFPQLNYTICASDNMKNLHSSMAEKSLWDGLKPDELQAVHTLLSEPVWQISPTNEAAIYNYTEDVIALGFLRQGHVLLSEEWQPNPGDFVLDKIRFPSMEETIKVIHRRGFKIVFTIQPFISTESLNFKDAVANRLLISERGSDARIPALTRYRQSNSASVLDITNNKTLPWLQTKLENLIKEYRVDSFYLDLGTAQDMPHYYKCEEPLTNPDHYKTIFTNSVLGTISVIGVSGAISRPRAPVFVSLPPFPSSWKAIKTVIPTVLSYGMIGYPFIMPGAVGGDVALPMSDNNPNNDFEVNLPDKELYVRWLQLSTFLPVIRFTHLPSKYSDESVLEMAKRLTELRQKTVTPLLKKYANETLDTGLPIIRPLWMLDPTDPACHVVVDEFSVGEELIVAPVLYSGSRQREVYLPAGVWKDGIDGSLRKGSRWIHNYRVAEDKVAYFVKMPDNTRF